MGSGGTGAGGGGMGSGEPGGASSRSGALGIGLGSPGAQGMVGNYSGGSSGGGDLRYGVYGGSAGTYVGTHGEVRDRATGKIIPGAKPPTPRDPNAPPIKYSSTPAPRPSTPPIKYSPGMKSPY